MSSADLPVFSADLPLTYRRPTADTRLTSFSADLPLTYRSRTADLPLTSLPLSGVYRGLSGARLPLGVNL